MSKFVPKELRYRRDESTSSGLAGYPHIQGETVAVGQAYHLDSEAQFKRDLEQSLAEIVKKRLQEAEDEAIALVKIAEETAENNARQIADDILTKANAQAEEMVALAQSQVQGILEAAREEGFKTGFQEGYADATTQVEQEATKMLKNAELLAENAYQAEQLILKNFEKNALALIVHLSRKILGQELKEAPDRLLEQVQHAVNNLYLSGKIKVVLNPQILQELRAFSAVTESALAAMNRFEFMVDPLLDEHQLFIVGEEGSFDLSLDTQITQRLAPLAEALVLPRPESSASDPLAHSSATSTLANAEAISPPSDTPASHSQPEDSSLGLGPIPDKTFSGTTTDNQAIETSVDAAASGLEEDSVLDDVELTVSPVSEALSDLPPTVKPFEFPAFEAPLFDLEGGQSQDNEEIL